MELTVVLLPVRVDGLFFLAMMVLVGLLLLSLVAKEVKRIKERKEKLPKNLNDQKNDYILNN